MDYKDYYAVLGVPRTASQKEIKKAFRKLAREHHPDTKGGDAAAEVRFKEINEANAVLSDPDKRALYDRLGADWQSYARAGAGAPAGRALGRAAPAVPSPDTAGSAARPGATSATNSTRPATPGEFSDFFNAFFAGDSEPLSTPGRGRRATGGATFESILAGMGLGADGSPAATRNPAPPARRRPPGAATAEATAEITLEEAYHGTSRLVEVEGKRLEVTIPRGADTGTRIRLTGKAPGGGDLHVVIRQNPDPVFTQAWRGPGARVAADPSGGAAGRGRQGPHAQGPRRAHDPGRDPAGPGVPAHRPGHAAVSAPMATATST